MLYEPEGSSTSAHDSRYKCVYLGERGILYMEAVAGDPVQCCVIQHHHTVCALRQTLQGQQGVVWLNYHVTVKKYRGRVNKQ